MEAQNQNQTPLKLRISRIFKSSFGKCNQKSTPDVVEQPIFATQNHQLAHLFSPEQRALYSISKPKWPGKPQTEHYFPRDKVSGRETLLPPVKTDGRKCPPATPISPGNPLFKLREEEHKPKRRNSLRKAIKSRTQLNVFSFELIDDYYDWFSSDDDWTEEDEEDDKRTLFSTKSLSSDSSASFRRRKARNRRKRLEKKESEKDLMPMKGKVKNSFAVVKRSSDPHSDFRTSMIEMIVERQIFGRRDLEKLLLTFLSLNSYRHHGAITEVFTEIWDALFSDWS